MEFKRVKYPYNHNSDDENDWYKFGSSEGAVKIDNKTIEDWVNKGIQSVKKQLENGVESPYSLTASGNTIVIVFFSMDNDEDIFSEENYFNVIVAKNYEEGTFFIEDLQKKYGEDEEMEDLFNELRNFQKDHTDKKIVKFGDYEIEFKRRIDD